MELRPSNTALVPLVLMLATALAELERSALTGGTVTDAQRRKAEDALEQAQVDVAKPWAERRAGAAAAIRAADHDVHTFVAEHLDELLEELGEDAEAAAAAVDSACRALLDAYAD